MSRLTTTIEAAVSGEHVTPFTLVELTFEDGVARATSLPFDVFLNGHTWSGISVLGSVSEVKEGPENRSYGITLTLTGIPFEFSSYLVKQKVQGKPVRVMLGFLNDAHEVIDTPLTILVGKMDTLDLKVGRETSVQIAVESNLLDWERARVRRFTDADQRARHPDDRGLEFVPQMVSKDLPWGRAS